MKKLILLAIGFGIFQFTYAQNEPQTPTKKDWSKVSLGNRSGDHLMIQFGYDGWAQKPDSIKTKGFSRSLNVYFLIDFPFKTDPRWSVAIGAGVGSSNIYFDNMIVGIAGNTTRLSFKNVADTSHFKKFKLSTNYLEAPLELRFSTDPENPNSSLKFALGGKIGTLVNAHTKGKTLQSRTDNTLNAYTMKEATKRYFNSVRVVGTARVGFGNFSLFGTYSITSILRDGAGPVMHPYSIGLTLSGL